MARFPIEPGAVTAPWLGEVLEADVWGCELEQIAIGVGLLGRLFRAHLDGGPDVPATVVVKLPTLDAAARSAICEDMEFYLREARFYQEIGLANPLRPARPYFAAFDDATHDFVLVLEDLGRLRLADQTHGCSVSDAETVIDAIAEHHAYWWESERFASLPWLKTFDTPSIQAGVIASYETSWPTCLERVGAGLSRELRDFGDRFASLMPWFLHEITRPPLTFLHGDLRLDQLFFAVGPGDPAVTALDWQLSTKGRGAYDVGYFLSQSLAADNRRSCEDRLLERYAERLAERGICYPPTQLLRDYRITTAWCFSYPVIASGGIDVANDRQLELLHTMLDGAVTAIEDRDGLSLRPD
jgi:hypothetical protein